MSRRIEAMRLVLVVVLIVGSACSKRASTPGIVIGGFFLAGGLVTTYVQPPRDDGSIGPSADGLISAALLGTGILILVPSLIGAIAGDSDRALAAKKGPPTDCVDSPRDICREQGRESPSVEQTGGGTGDEPAR